MIHSQKDSKEFNKKSLEYKNKFKHKVLQSSDTYEMTKEQGNLARQSRITSTIGEKLIELLIKYNPKEIENDNREHGLLSQSLGFSIRKVG